MTYPYPHKARIRQKEVHGSHISGSCSAGTVSFTFNTPPGSWAIGYTVMGVGNDKPFVGTITPWVDHEQTVLSDGQYKFLRTGGSTATTNLTIAATSTKHGTSGMLIPAGDQYGAAAPVLTVHGGQVTIATTATTGTWEFTYTAVEL